MSQMRLFDKHSDGQTYDHERDHDRLTRQRGRVWDALKDEQWHTLGWLSAMTGDPEASVSARIRDFRKPKFGGYNIERRHVENGLFEYRLLRRKHRMSLSE